MKQVQHINLEELGLHEHLQHELASYPAKIVGPDGSVTVQKVQTSYFLVNDTWNLDILETIPQFTELSEDYKGRTRNVHFAINSLSVNLEVKYIWYQKVFREEWSVITAFDNKARFFKKIAVFFNEKYPYLSSLLDIDVEKTEREWLFWLQEHGFSTQRRNQHVVYGEYKYKSEIANFFRTLHSTFLELTDTREEWEKDRWDVRILNEQYGISYLKSRSDYYLNFTNIEQTKLRGEVKRYLKQRLLGNNNFSVRTAQNYLSFLPKFFSFIFSIQPTWSDLRSLKRTHMEQYIQWLHKQGKNNSNKNSHPESYVEKALKCVGKFLTDIQDMEYPIAPQTPLRLLLFPSDKPKLRKKAINEIDYVPDSVLEQLFTHINDLHSDVVPVVWVAYKTGLRISDVLGLTVDCLERFNGKYSIVTDIEKTYVVGHRIPIDEELANLLAVLIHNTKKNSNSDNNPDGFIFIRYRGSRKGHPYSQRWVQDQLNILAHKKQILDENGEVFHFKMHQFRHTYAVKMLNAGMDILTLQELLAHASPEMTLRYAKLLDNTKREKFEEVIKQGVFSFDLNGEVQEIKTGEDIPEDLLQALWQDHKLNAMDNPYGTCHARLKGDCPHMEAPPCLTCNGGNPCKDLAIGFSELDVEKYVMHVKTTTRAMEVAKQHGRDDMAEKHEHNLERYQDILENLRRGNIIFGRQDRIKKRLGGVRG